MDYEPGKGQNPREEISTKSTWLTFFLAAFQNVIHFTVRLPLALD